MSRRDERPKATELHSNPYFQRQQVGFAEAFSEIEELRVEVRENGKGSSGASFYSKLNPPGQFIDCSNSICYGGGINFELMLRQLAGDRVTTKEEILPCAGYEGSQQGRRRYGKCFNTFGFKISIKYRNSSS